MSQQVLYRLHRRRGPMVPAAIAGLLQIAVGVDTLFTHLVIPGSPSVLTTVASILFIVLGTAICLFVGAQIGFSPPVLEATEEGLRVYITEPGSAPIKIPWDALKGVEIGRPHPDKEGRDNPTCLILRFTGSRVGLPSTLVGVYHATKGSLCFRASQLPPLEPAVERLNALREEPGTPTHGR